MGSPLILWIDNGALSRCVFVFIGRQNMSLTKLDLQSNQIGYVGASGLGAGLVYASCRSFDDCSFPFHTTRIDNGPYQYSIVYFFYSHNTSLTEMLLRDNQIGDAGAASIGDALAYVQTRYPTMFCVYIDLTKKVFHRN